jgi:hypothetical protein
MRFGGNAAGGNLPVAPAAGAHTLTATPYGGQATAGGVVKFTEV